MLDLAVAVVIGAAFSKIVDSLVKDLLTPALTPLTSVADFSAFKIGPFAIGSFINNVIQFVIVAFALFLIVKLTDAVPDAVPDTKKTGAEKPYNAALQVEQNKEMIALLKTIADKS